MRPTGSFILAVITGLTVASQAMAESECERQKQRFQADNLAPIQRGIEALGKGDDRGYCTAAQQGLVTAKAYYDWARQSGCLAGDAAQRAKALDQLKQLVDKSRENADAACR